VNYPTVPASGGVSTVTASLPIVSSGGATPNLSWNANVPGAARVNLLGPYTTDQTISATAWDGCDLVRIVADVDTAASDLTFTLPAATGIGNVALEIVNFANPSAYAVKVAGVTVAGAASPVTLYTCAYGCARLVTDGSDWLAGDLNTRLTTAAASGIHKVAQTITHASLTTVGTTQSITLGAVPAGARCLGFLFSCGTLFSGGGVVSLSLDIGWSGTLGAIIDTAVTPIDLVAGTINGAAGTAATSAGLGYGTTSDGRDIGGKTVLATFTCDGANTLDELTAGSVYVEVWYFTPA